MKRDTHSYECGHDYARVVRNDALRDEINGKEPLSSIIKTNYCGICRYKLSQRDKEKLFSYAEEYQNSLQFLILRDIIRLFFNH